MQPAIAKGLDDAHLRSVAADESSKKEPDRRSASGCRAIRAIPYSPQSHREWRKLVWMQSGDSQRRAML